MTESTPHISVLKEEVLAMLDLHPGDNVIDGTLGAGGHAKAILEKTSPNGRLLGCDLDETALGLARNSLALFGDRAMLVRGNYRDITQIVAEASFGPVQAALLDLGYSSMEIDDPSRGFSFRNDGPLDMRFDSRQERTAAEIVNTWPEEDLAQMIYEFGEDRNARRIASAIVRARREKRIVGTLQLADVIIAATPGVRFGIEGRPLGMHPATRTFQALRIVTNDELGNVREGLTAMFDALAPGARFAVISFHSLEDRIVKETFKALVDAKKGELLTKKPIVPADEESAKNPRARSSKLRGIRKL